jgi:phospholipid N-methyltransferase
MSLTRFASQAITDFQSTAAVAPSSRYLAREMVRPLPLASAKTVVELGPGTGVMTGALLDSLPADSTVLAFEISDSFVRHLRRTIADPRLEVVHAGAETAGDELRRRGITRVDAALSSLGSSLMPDGLMRSILAGLEPFLDGESVFTQFQYMHRIRVREGRVSYFDVEPLLREFFRDIRRSSVWINLPPAFVFDCRR